MKELITTLLNAASLHAKLKGEPVPQSYIDQLKLWGAGIFRIVVMGEIKKGKSSFINAMLGEKDLVPVSSNVATSTIFKIRYGKEKGYRVHFSKDSGKETVAVAAEEIGCYGTEDGNPGNEKKVDYIEVICPAALLKSGIVIIDTPGLGGLFKEHKKITWQYVPRADAVFFVTDSVESPIGSLELEYLDAVRAITPHFYFVQTKCCAVDSQARAARRTNNLSILSSHLGVPQDHIPYFTVDSTLRFEAKNYKDMEDIVDSGYPSLLSFIGNELQCKQKKILAGRAIAFSRPILQSLTTEIEARKRMLNADSEAERQKIATELEAARIEWQKWQDHKMPQLEKDFQRGMMDINNHATDKCNIFCSQGALQKEMDAKVDAAANAEELSKVVDMLLEMLPERASQVCCDIRGQVERETKELLQHMSLNADSASTQNTEDNGSLYNSTLEQLSRDLKNRKTLTSDNVRTYVMGGAAGKVIGGVIGGILGSVVPGIGNAWGAGVGAALGSIWGGWSAGANKVGKELEGAKHQAKTGVAQAIASLGSQIQVMLRKMLREVELQVGSAFKQYVREYTADLHRRQKDLTERGNMTNAEIAKKRRENAELENAMSSIMRTLMPWMPGNPVK